MRNCACSRASTSSCPSVACRGSNISGFNSRPCGGCCGIFGSRPARDTAGHTRVDANVCLMGTHCATLLAVKYFAWDDAKNAKLKADRGGSVLKLMKAFSDAVFTTPWLTDAPFRAN